MSTKSRIGILNNNETVTSIYVHHDGYPKWTGAILKKYYTDPKKIVQLMKLGDLSQINKKIEPKGKQHSFNNPEIDVTIAYGRDKGEKIIKPMRSKNDEDYIDSGLEYADYLYLFNPKSKQWLVRRKGMENWMDDFDVF